MTYNIQKTDQEWKQQLTSEEYQVLRKAGTEAPWSGILLDEHRNGIFTCKACNAELFKSTTKFESGSGWPSFYEPITAEAVQLKKDRSWLITRTEVLCATCGSHLGHLFDDAYQTPTGDRYCMNSLSLGFTAQD